MRGRWPWLARLRFWFHRVWVLLFQTHAVGDCQESVTLPYLGWKASQPPCRCNYRYWWHLLWKRGHRWHRIQISSNASCHIWMWYNWVHSQKATAPIQPHHSRKHLPFYPFPRSHDNRRWWVQPDGVDKCRAFCHSDWCPRQECWQVRRLRSFRGAICWLLHLPMAQCHWWYAGARRWESTQPVYLSLQVLSPDYAGFQKLRDQRDCPVSRSRSFRRCKRQWHLHQMPLPQLFQSPARFPRNRHLRLDKWHPVQGRYSFCQTYWPMPCR